MDKTMGLYMVLDKELNAKVSKIKDMKDKIASKNVEKAFY